MSSRPRRTGADKAKDPAAEQKNVIELIKGITGASTEDVEFTLRECGGDADEAAARLVESKAKFELVFHSRLCDLVAHLPICFGNSARHCTSYLPSCRHKSAGIACEMQMCRYAHANWLKISCTISIQDLSPCIHAPTRLLLCRSFPDILSGAEQEGKEEKGEIAFSCACSRPLIFCVCWQFVYYFPGEMSSDSRR